MADTIQEIYNLVHSYLPKKWSKTVMYIEYSGKSYTMNFFVKEKFHGYTDCYSLGHQPRDILSLFDTIHSIIYPERSSLPNKMQWTVMTLIFDGKGHCDIEYDYSDHSKNMIGWESNWRKKYLV